MQNDPTRIPTRRRPGAGLALALLLMLVALALPAAGEGRDAVVGVWITPETENGYSHIEIRREGELYRGRIVWLSKPTYPPEDPEGMGGEKRVDRENPDPSLDRRPILGLELMWGFRYTEGEWTGGRIYDPESGRTYKARMRIGLEGTLLLRGFLGFSLIGRTSEWYRLEAEEKEGGAAAPNLADDVSH